MVRGRRRQNVGAWQGRQRAKWEGKDWKGSEVDEDKTGRGRPTRGESVAKAGGG